MPTFDSKLVKTDPKKINEISGQIIKWIRTVMKCDQGALAELIQTSQSSLSQLEAGKRRLTPETAGKIAGAFKIPATYLTTLMIPDDSVPQGPVQDKLKKLQSEIRDIIIKEAKPVLASREEDRLEQLRSGVKVK